MEYFLRTAGGVEGNFFLFSDFTRRAIENGRPHIRRKGAITALQKKSKKRNKTEKKEEKEGQKNVLLHEYYE